MQPHETEILKEDDNIYYANIYSLLRVFYMLGTGQSVLCMLPCFILTLTLQVRDCGHPLR